jgi:hypothetical protein
MKRVCKFCGVFEEDHHEPYWLEIPDGCVCDWREWDAYDAIPPVCSNFTALGSRCVNCEHDKACHKAK